MEPRNGHGADKFNPPANTPQEIALKWPDGRPCQSPYCGDQVRFVLTDERQWYLDPPTAARVHALQLSAGELFVATRKEIARGNRRSFEWDLRRIAAEAAPPAPASVVQPPAVAAVSEHVQPHPTATAPVAAPVVNGPTKAALIESGRIAVDAVIAVEAYAHDNGFADFSFGAENIQKVWLAVFIDAQRRFQR